MDTELPETRELVSWVQDGCFEGFNPIWYNYIHTIDYNFQRQCIRKIIEAHRLGYTIISEYGIDVVLNNHSNTIAVDVYIVLQCIQSTLKNNRLPYTWELFGTIRNVYNGKDLHSFMELFEVIRKSNLFDHCLGYSYIRRYDAIIGNDGCKSVFDFDGYDSTHSVDKKSRWHHIRGTFRVNPKDLSSTLTLNYEEDIKDVVSLLKIIISRREYNKENRVWFFPAGTINDILYFLRESVKHKYFFEIELSDKKTDLSLHNWQSVVMQHHSGRRFCFCEGKEWNYPYLGNCRWCNGNACFCDGMVAHNDYKNYTLYDMLNIIEGDNISRQAMEIVYSAYNRLASLIEYKHLFCKDCKQTLEPKHDKGYNARRVIWFRCANKQCNQYSKDIYLNHCFQKECGSIIDSRETMKCKNGFYICKECGACCACSQYERKIGANIPVSSYVLNLITECKMHLDGGEKPVFFCHKCGEQLEYKEFSKPLDYNRKKVYGYSQCPNHEEHFVVYPYAKGVKEFVKKMEFPNKKE